MAADSLGGGMWIRVIEASEMFVSDVRKVRKSDLEADHGRLPIQMPYSERLAGWLGSGLSSSEAEERMSALNFDGGSIGACFAFLALRSAFFDGGSGALMSTSSSSIVASCRLRFLDDGSGEADLELDVELGIFCEYSQTP